MATFNNNESGLSVRNKINESITAQEANTTKLSGIEDGAEVNPTAAEIKTSYESNADTNAFTDSEKTKLSGIETGAQVNEFQKVYAAVLDISGGVSATVVKDTFEGTISWSNVSPGAYLATNTESEFVSELTVFRAVPNEASFITVEYTSSTVITVTVRDTSGTLVDNYMDALKVEILNYNV